MTETAKTVENRRKLVAELRSGKYRQIRGWLTDGNGGFCCLGVACEMMRVPRMPGRPKTYDWGDGRTYDDHPDARWWAENFGQLDMILLATMNDEGDSFRKIAEYVEKHG